MKYHLLKISLLVLLLGCTKSPYRHQRNLAARDLSVKKKYIKIIKVDSTYLYKQLPGIIYDIERLNEQMKQLGINDTLSIYDNSYFEIDIKLNHLFLAYFDTLLYHEIDDSSKNYYRYKRDEIRTFQNNYYSTVDSIIKDLNNLGIKYYPLNSKMFDTLNLFFVKDINARKSFIFDFNKKGKTIDRKIKYSDH
ncbi:MAG: hypothetical protein ABF289_10555 [Clostridiales bacterium]